MQYPAHTTDMRFVNSAFTFTTIPEGGSAGPLNSIFTIPHQQLLAQLNAQQVGSLSSYRVPPAASGDSAHATSSSSLPPTGTNGHVTVRNPAAETSEYESTNGVNDEIVAGPSHTPSSGFADAHADSETSFRLSAASTWRTRSPSDRASSPSSSEEDFPLYLTLSEKAKGKVRDASPSKAAAKRKRASASAHASASPLPKRPRRRNMLSAAVSQSASNRGTPNTQEARAGQRYRRQRLSENSAAQQDETHEAEVQGVEPDDASDVDSEEEVLRYLKRPRTHQPFLARMPAQDPVAPEPESQTFKTRKVLSTDSALIQIEDTIFHLPKSRLVQSSDYFAEIFGRESDTDDDDEESNPPVIDSGRIVKVTGVSAKDFEATLNAYDNIRCVVFRSELEMVSSF